MNAFQLPWVFLAKQTAPSLSLGSTWMGPALPVTYPLPFSPLPPQPRAHVPRAAASSRQASCGSAVRGSGRQATSAGTAEGSIRSVAFLAFPDDFSHSS